VQLKRRSSPSGYQHRSDSVFWAYLAVQPRGLSCADEELGALGVWTSVSHREDARTGVLQSEVLVVELAITTIDALATSALMRQKNVSGA
jgi:hypothetical protein